MALKNISEVSTIQGPQFINLEPLDINPLMSKCEIKVFYLGHNRNGSYINRSTAEDMAKTLRGTPIVAAWSDQKGDFGDHGHIMHIEDGKLTTSCKTVPYGFVSPDAKIWFQNFIDTDEFENQVERTYLMTTGYLWSGQFEELNKVITQGQPQSMELDDKTLDGHWATDNNLGVEFFIINDAVFSKLCILGDDVEPCFEGSAVTSPEVSKDFANRQDFEQTLFTMMNELKEALQSKGGSSMPDEFAEQTEIVDESAAEAPAEEFAVEETVEEPVAEEVVDYSNADGAADDSSDEPEGETEFVKDDDKDDSEDEEVEPEDEDDEEEDEEKPTNHSLEEFEAMESELSSLRAEVEELREFKLGIENQQKDALINSYHMLSDEDKADVIEHKSEYSLEEIESKLAVIYVHKNVDFESLTGQPEDISFEAEQPVKEEEDPTMTFSLDDEVAGFVPSLVQALRQTVNK